jgi:cysteine desulfurase
MEIYLDNAATTKIDEEVFMEINEFNNKYYANPSSQHRLGRELRKRIDSVRRKIAEYIGANEEEVIFTSGATESNNLAIKGLAEANVEKKHIITSVIEHPSILEVCKTLEKKGYEIDYIKVNEEGIVDLKEIEKRIRKDTLVVCIMHINNEIGTIQPIKEIGELCKRKGVYFHSDCVQSFKKIPIDVKRLNIDLLSVSGHKINAPKGVGFLYIKIGTRIKPLIDGGGQEFRIRGGTENILGIVGLGKAIDINRGWEEVEEIRDFLIEELKEIEGSRINGSLDLRSPSNISVSFYGIEGESLLLMLEEENIFVSTGSACASHNLEESHVLKSIGLDEMYIHGTIRITLDKSLTREEVIYVVDKIKKSVERLRKISPFKFEGERE